MLKQLQEIIQSVQGIPTKINSSYEFDGIVVPRVTAILSDMLHEDYLMDWSNYLGLYKHQKYKDVLDAAADKGSSVAQPGRRRSHIGYCPAGILLKQPHPGLTLSRLGKIDQQFP